MAAEPDRFIDYARYTFADTWIPSTPWNAKTRGYMGDPRVILGIEDVRSVIADVTKELSARGLTTEELFSSRASDLSAITIRRFIACYVVSLTNPLDTIHSVNLRAGTPFELAWFLRWALGRIVRVVTEEESVAGAKGVIRQVKELQQRGLVEWTEYAMWREKERATGFPEKSINAFFSCLPCQLATLLNTLFELFSRLIAHHPTSSLIPCHIATLFGPLIFGLNPAASSVGVGTFVETHAAYVKEVAATRHLVLAWIRRQRALHDRLTGDFPWTLSEWIVDYPQQIMDPPHCAQIRIYLIHRTVRSYSPDLLATHREWVNDSWASWRALGEVKMTERHRIRLGMRSANTESAGFDELGLADEELTDRLRFDLGERAKQEVTMERASLLWTDFASPDGGFDRSPHALDESLALGHPVLDAHLAHWPAEREALCRKLVEGQKGLPAFEGEEVKIEEVVAQQAFVDCWADLLVGGGWMEEDELTYRRANWVMIEYDKKAGGSTMFVFEEHVPQEYQNALLTPPKKRHIFNRFPRHSVSKAQEHRQIEIAARLKKHQSKRVVSAGKLQTTQIGKPLPATPPRQISSTSPRWMTSPPRSSVETGLPGRQQQDALMPSSDESPRSVRFLERVGRACGPRWEPSDSLEEGARLMRLGGTRMRDSPEARDSGRLTCEFVMLDFASMLMAPGVVGIRPLAHALSPIVVSEVPHRNSELSGFHVVSRDVSAMGKGQLGAAFQQRPQDLTLLKLSTPAWNSYDTGSPLSPISCQVATQELIGMSPHQVSRVIRHRPGDIDTAHQARSLHVEPEYFDNSPVPALPSKDETSMPRPDDSVSIIDSVYSADPPAPVFLGKPLPLPPRYRDSAQRDTLFSVIDEYTVDRNTTLVDGSTRDISVDSEAFQRFASHNNQTAPPSSQYRTDDEITFGSPDREDTFSTWDCQAQHSDDTIMGTTLEGTAVYDEAVYEPPPKLEDIEAIARQPSPGRYGHGIPLEFVDEVSEEDVEERR